MADIKLEFYDENGNIIDAEKLDCDEKVEEMYISPLTMTVGESSMVYGNSKKIYKILIDPGHGKDYNAGIVKGYYEGNVMYELGVLLQRELGKYSNLQVDITRKSITDFPDLDQRGKMANGYNLVISLHSDAANNANAVGTTIFYSVNRPKSLQLATELGIAISTTINLSTGVTLLRGVTTKPYSSINKSMDYYAILRNSVVHSSVEHAILIEHGFHTNLKECQYLFNSDNLAKLAVMEANVIAKHIGATIMIDEDTKEPSGVSKYSVWVENGIPGYYTAIDAINNSNRKSRVPYGRYSIYKIAPNGAINLTNDPTGLNPGSWINPVDNPQGKVEKDESSDSDSEGESKTIN